MHNDFNDEQLEKLLNEAPKIEDLRSKEDVFNRLKSEGLFQQSNENIVEDQQNSRPTKRTFPYKRYSSFAAIAVVAIIIPTLLISLNNSSMNDEASFDGSEKEEAFEMDIQSFDKGGTEESAANDFSITNVRMMDLRKNLYENELSNEIVFTIGLSSHAADSVLLSSKLSPEMLLQYGVNEEATYLQLYEAIVPSIDETALGFHEMHPLKGKLIENGRTLIHQLPSDHPYDGSSAQIETYFSVMQDTFGGHYDALVLQDESGNPIRFSEVGVMNEPIPLVGMRNQMNYFKYTDELGMTYLTTNFNKTFNTLEEALYGLYEEWNDVYKTAMIPAIQFTIDQRGNYVAIQFTQPLDVTEYEAENLMLMLEAIILTAASFDQQVKFENVVQSSFGGFEFTEVIPAVKGINEVPYLLQ